MLRAVSPPRGQSCHTEVCPNLPVDDGIHAARMLLARCWFDEKRCAPGLEALLHYRKDFNTRLQVFKDTPLHDWASNGADAFRYLAVRQKPPKEVKQRDPMQSRYITPTDMQHMWMS